MPTEEVSVMPENFVGRAVPIDQQDKRPTPRKQILEMQAILRKGMSDPDATLTAKAHAARAWQVLEDALWQEQNKPKLAPVKPSEMPMRKARVIEIAREELPVHLQGGQTAPGDATDPSQA